MLNYKDTVEQTKWHWVRVGWSSAFYCYHHSLILITCGAMGGGSHKKENQISRLENWRAVLLGTKIIQLDLSHSEKRNGKVNIPIFM